MINGVEWLRCVDGGLPLYREVSIAIENIKNRPPANVLESFYSSCITWHTHTPLNVCIIDGLVCIQRPAMMVKVAARRRLSSKR